MLLLPKMVSTPTRARARARARQPLEGVPVREEDTAQRRRSEGRKELERGRYRLVDEQGRT